MSNLAKLTLLAAGVLLALAALAHAYLTVVPSNCTYPTTIDALVTFKPGEVIPSANWNQMSCILDKLMRWVKSIPAQEKLCASPTTLAASVRQSVTLTAAAPFVGSEVVLPQMPVDSIDPPAVALDGIDAPSSSSVRVWLFNRDADRSRTVTLCATVVRP